MFVNVCSHPRIDPVCGANLVPVSEEHLDTWGLGNARVPVLVGPTRPMLDSDGHAATAVDVLFHPSVVRRALTGGKSVTKEHFRDYLVDIAAKNVAEDHGVDLAPGRNTVMEVARYKGPGGENKDNTHAFPVFAEEKDDAEPRAEKDEATAERLEDAVASASSARAAEPPRSCRAPRRETNQERVPVVRRGARRGALPRGLRGGHTQARRAVRPAGAHPGERPEKLPRD